MLLFFPIKVADALLLGWRPVRADDPQAGYKYQLESPTSAVTLLLFLSFYSTSCSPTRSCYPCRSPFDFRSAAFVHKALPLTTMPSTSKTFPSVQLQSYLRELRAHGHAPPFTIATDDAVAEKEASMRQYLVAWIEHWEHQTDPVSTS